MEIEPVAAFPNLSFSVVILRSKSMVLFLAALVNQASGFSGICVRQVSVAFIKVS
jgi:hypothetical protein